MIITAWILTLYIQHSGMLIQLQDYGANKPTCDEMAASFNAGKDTGVQVFTCVSVREPMNSWEAPTSAARVSTAPIPGICDGLTSQECFMRGAAIGMELPR